jgi:2'-5' RNA ligase
MSLLAISYPDLSKTDFDRIQNIRLKYDREYIDIINPHFTLVFPVDDKPQEDFIKHITASVSSIKNISFVLCGATVHKDQLSNNWYLFLTPDEGYNDIIKLHDRLYTGLLKDNLRSDLPYIPHITIGLFDNARECKEAADFTNKEGISIAGEINSIDIIDFQNNLVEKIKKISLRCE